MKFSDLYSVYLNSFFRLENLKQLHKRAFRTFVFFVVVFVFFKLLDN